MATRRRGGAALALSVLLGTLLGVLPMYGSDVAASNFALAIGESEGFPRLVTLAPQSGSPGTEVDITGHGFTRSGNTVRFGPGYIHDLASTDGRTLQFIVPDGLDLCPPGPRTQCPDGFPQVVPGLYEVSVLTSEGESNRLQFTVTGRPLDTR
ncbi:MAG TPA: IPT/TIG domain-containing protein [Patescibacteria group bacterium]|nr:IPT/TIG domain-containing protein [Patescibacteria group bacterium]